MLAGCQPGSVSVEEARRITTRVLGAPVTAPPETIDDVLALLAEGPAPEWRARMARDRALVAQAEPGPGARPDEQINFLYGRGLASMDAGRAARGIDDLTRAVELARRFPGAATERLLSALAYAHFVGGNASQSARRWEESMAGAPLPPVTGRHALLAWFFARRGDLERAVVADSRARSMLPEAETSLMSGDRRNAAFLLGLRASVALGTAGLWRLRGQHGEADSLYRHALAEVAVSLGRKEQAEYMSFANVEDYKVQVKWRAHTDAAINLIAAGRLDEAELQARDAVRTAVSRYGSDAPYVGSALSVLGEVLLAQGRFADADRLAAAALAIYARGGVLAECLGRAQARRLQAAALLLRGRPAEARTEFEAITGDMQADRESLDGIFGGDLDWALALVRANRAPQAVERLLPAVAGMARRLPPADYSLAEARAVLGTALAAAGQLERALAELRAAVPVLLAGAAKGDGRAMVSLREWRRQETIEAYVELLARVRGTPLEASAGVSPVAEGFRLADAARGRSVQRAVGAGAARAAAARDAVLLDLVQREQASEAQLATLHRQLADLTIRPRKGKDDPRPTPEAVRAQAEDLTQARAALGEEIRRRFPAYAEVMEPQPATVEQARSALDEGEALVALLVGRERTHVWAVTRTGDVVAAAAPVSREEVAALVGRVRRSVTPVAGTPAEQPVFDAEAAHRLYATLLQPVERGWRGARRVIVVPHGPLGQLPFSLLLTAPGGPGPSGPLAFAEYRAMPFLVRESAIVQLPSVASAKILKAVPAAAPGRRPFIGFGDPWFSVEQARRAEAETAVASPAGVAVRSAPLARRVGGGRLADLDRLPDTREEILALARTLAADPARDVHLGRGATERAVKTADLAAYQVVVFATHGLVPGTLEGLSQPALAFTAPEVAGGEGDGLLTMEEVLGLKLNADWVVLSACDTAAGAGAGAEAVSGLGRAFFYAGTRAVLVTHWPVESTSARALTTELFRRRAADTGLARAEALREAQLALIDGPGAMDAAGRPEYAYAHPMFWAPFALVGDGGR